MGKYPDHHLIQRSKPTTLSYLLPNSPMTDATIPAQDTKTLSTLIANTLEDAKAVDIVQIDVRELTDITENMIICHGTSGRHASALAQIVMKATLAEGIKAASIEGDDTGEWVLIDYVDVLVHIMKREAREYYEIERLWDERLSRQSARENTTIAAQG